MSETGLGAGLLSTSPGLLPSKSPSASTFWRGAGGGVSLGGLAWAATLLIDDMGFSFYMGKWDTLPLYTLSAAHG